MIARVATFDDIGELFHVVVRFAIVNHSSNRENHFGLDLRKPVENTLRQNKWNTGLAMKKKNKKY